MAKPKLPSQKEAYRKLNNRLARYVMLVRSLYEEMNKKASQIAISQGYEGEGEFHFSDSPITDRRFKEIQQTFASDLESIIHAGTSEEWKNSNLAQDLLANKVLSFYDVTKTDGTQYRKYYETNSDALKAFQERKIGGMNLSQKIWSQAQEHKIALEETISVAIQKGMSAVTLSKLVSQYLQDFDKIRADYTEKFGKKAFAKDCEYKSMRLARSEINMAYRTAEQTRWRQMDFIVGYEIKLSGRHPAHDICDDLKGKYPKDFVWTGWHPNDMCYVIPILNTEDEFWSIDKTISVNEITDVPENYKNWVLDNAKRIEIANAKGTLPYFLRDNKVYSGLATKLHPVGLGKVVDGAMKAHNANLLTAEQERKREIQRIADERHNARTPEQIESIQSAWNERRAVRHYGRNILSYIGGISDIDTTPLANALKTGNNALILKEARALKAQGKEILALNYLDNPMQLAREFSKADAITVNNAVRARIKVWEGAGLSLEKQKDKLLFEIDWVKNAKKYPTWEHAQRAYEKQLAIVEDAIEWQTIKNEYISSLAYDTKSAKWKKLVAKLDEDIAKKDKVSAQQTILELKERRKAIEYDRAYAKKLKMMNDNDAYSQERKNNALWCKSEYESMQEFNPYAEKLHNSVSKAERDAAWGYTEGSGYINRPLRGYDETWDSYNFKGIGNVPWDNERLDGTKHINDLTKYIDKSSYDKDIWLQRGISASGLKGFLQIDDLDISKVKTLVGRVVEDAGFFSCGAAKGTGFSGNTLNVYCPRGTKMVYIDGRSKYANLHENEMLIQRGTKFRITKIEQSYGGRYFIDIEVVGQI